MQNYLLVYEISKIKIYNFDSLLVNRHVVNQYLSNTFLLINNHEHHTKYHRNEEKTLIEHNSAVLIDTPHYH